MTHSLPNRLIEPLVTQALAEDLGDRGDITTQTTIPVDSRAQVSIRARQPGTIAGIECARLAFHLVDESVQFTVENGDGANVAPGDIVARIEGPARAILTAERVALNFMGHLSGIATLTHQIATSIAHTKAKVTCTRKTTPGLRAVEKLAVRLGGGINHRFGLYDAILIKDNHIAIAGGIDQAIKGALANKGHLVKVEVEVDTLEQLKQALTHPIDAVLLDNMSTDQLREAVGLIKGKVTAEASGGITAQTAPAIAETGVDLLSVGWITHSAPCLDLGLDFET